MTYYCPACGTHWAPYQCTNGACPECGTGTRRTYCVPDTGTRERHRTATAARDARDELQRRLSEFEAFYAAWCSTEPGDSLELSWGLPPVDPEAEAA